MTFFTAYNRPKTIPAPVGRSEAPIFDKIFDGNEWKLAEVGLDDIKGRIEASKSDCLIENIIRKFQQGDLSVLSRSQGFYSDTVGMPENLMQAQNFLIKCKNQFESLPLDVRSKFDNNFDNYLREVSSFSVDEFNSTFFDKMQSSSGSEGSSSAEKLDKMQSSSESEDK